MTDMRIARCVIGLLLLVGTLGCATTPRFTQESLFVGSPPEIVVMWPRGTALDDVKTVEVEGTVFTVSPLTLPAE